MMQGTMSLKFNLFTAVSLWLDSSI